MKLQKKWLWIAAVSFCFAFCSCQTPQEDAGTTPIPTESVAPESTPYIAPTEAVAPDAKPSEEPTSVPEFSPTPAIPQSFDDSISDARVVVDGIVYTCDIYVADGMWYVSAEDVERVFDVALNEKYLDLDSFARENDISYEQDTVLNAAYFSTWEPYQKMENSFDFERAFTLCLVPEEYKVRASEQITSTEFRGLLVDLITKLAPEKLSRFDENVTMHETAMSREQGFVMAFYAAECIGANNFNNDFDNTRADGGDFWDCDWNDYTSLYPHVFEGPYYCGWEGTPESEWTDWGDLNTAAHLWSFWHSSPVSGNLMFTFDEEAGSMHKKDALTVQEAVSVVTRLYDSAGAKMVSILDVTVTEGFSQNLTAELRKKLEEAPEITAENHPIWTGLILGYAFYHQMYDNTEELRMCANFGFNSARLLLDYEPLFNSDITEVNLTNLQTLDRMVETAIQYNLHLNLCFTTLPGRTTYRNPEDFTSVGSFDLFVNEEKQKQVNRLWATLAERYAEVPNAYLSMTPFWEATNYNLSSGLPAPEYTMEDIGNYLVEVVGAIREQDEERLVIYEPTSINGYNDITEQCSLVKPYVKDVENIMISYNFCENPYTYANMTDVEGENIDDNNRSVFWPEYPTQFYSIGWNVDEDHPITFTGFLPAGTVVDIYLEESWDTTLNLSADGEIIYSEYIEKTQYETSNHISIYYQYATSEKKISVTLEEKADELVLFCTGSGVEISGMDVYLPEEYAVERWYKATAYDVYKGFEEEEGLNKKLTSRIMISPNEYNYLTNIEILEDVSFKTGKIWAESSETTVKQWGESISGFDGNCVVRYEAGGEIWENMVEYYQDLLDMCVDKEFSWWSNDWYTMTAGVKHMGGAPSIEYTNYPQFNIELLKLLQEHQNSDRLPRGNGEPELTATPTPTETPKPTEVPVATPVPTSTPVPTATVTPVPTSTPTPMSSADRRAWIKTLQYEESWIEELLLAEEIGLPVEKLEQKTVSGAELAEILDAFIAYAAPDKVAEWKKAYPKYRNSNDALKRFDAMTLTYLAARTIGGRYAIAAEDWYEAASSTNHSWDEGYLTMELYGEEAHQQIYCIDDYGDNYHHLDGGAFYYNFGRKSTYSGEYPYAYDASSNSIRVNDKATYAEAVLAVARIILTRTEYDLIHEILADSTFIKQEDTKAVQPYLDAAAKRKEEILNSKTEIVKSDTFIRGETYTGTAYYFSADGDDNNDGLSPETPKKDIGVLSVWQYDGTLQPGDAVFFERGKIYRVVNQAIVPGAYVTYSAYGKGDKPVFTMAAENAAYPECWELYYEDATGKKIWKYNRNLQDTGGIIFNEGEAYAARVWEWPTKNGWLALDFTEGELPINGVYPDGVTNAFITSAGECRSVEDVLTENMTFVSRVNLEGLNYPGQFCWKWDGEQNSGGEVGPVYLRCDAGNPGEIYYDIEVVGATEGKSILCVFDTWGVDGYVIDNLSFKYVLCPIWGNNNNTDPVIQNCTFEWQVCRMHTITSEEPTEGYSIIGDNIYCATKNAIIRNNYAYQCSNLCTFENTEAGVPMGNYVVEGNLAENCGEGIRVIGVQENSFDKMILRDNMIIGMGDTYSINCFERFYAITICTDPVKFAKEVIIEDNVCIGSKYGLLSMNESLDAEFKNNVFIQKGNGALMYLYDKFRWIWMKNAFK